MVDNPRLTNRLFHGRSPLRLVLDRTLRLPKDLYLFDGSEETWVFTESTDCPELEKVRYVNVHFEEAYTNLRAPTEDPIHSGRRWASTSSEFYRQ